MRLARRVFARPEIPLPGPWAVSAQAVSRIEALGHAVMAEAVLSLQAGMGFARVQRAAGPTAMLAARHARFSQSAAPRFY